MTLDLLFTCTLIPLVISWYLGGVARLDRHSMVVNALSTGSIYNTVIGHFSVNHSLASLVWNDNVNVEIHASLRYHLQIALSQSAFSALTCTQAPEATLLFLHPLRDDLWINTQSLVVEQSRSFITLQLNLTLMMLVIGLHIWTCHPVRLLLTSCYIILGLERSLGIPFFLVKARTVRSKSMADGPLNVVSRDLHNEAMLLVHREERAIYLLILLRFIHRGRVLRIERGKFLDLNPCSFLQKPVSLHNIDTIDTRLSIKRANTVRRRRYVILVYVVEWWLVAVFIDLFDYV